MVTQVRPTSLSRRSFFKLAVSHAIGISSVLYLLPGQSLRAGGGDQHSDKIQQSLALIAHDLFPHQNLDDQIYQKVAQAISGEMSFSAEKKKKILEGMSRLDALTPTIPWDVLNPDERIELLKKYQTDPFFAYIHNLSLEIIYRDPEVWKLIGYGGSSIERGGYLNRGFNDISWLPEKK